MLPNMMPNLPALEAAVRKSADIMAEDPNTPICRAQVVGEAGAVLERLRLALEAALDQTIVEPTDEVADLKTRLETINKIVRQAVDLAA